MPNVRVLGGFFVLVQLEHGGGRKDIPQECFFRIGSLFFTKA
jgi:hypothetical protein